MPPVIEKLEKVLAFAKDCGFAEEHSWQVAKISVKIFDGTTALHGLTENERFWLECVALLHDIGWRGGRAGPGPCLGCRGFNL